MHTPLAWLAGLAVVALTAGLARLAAARLAQTAVVGEIVVGILLAQILMIAAPQSTAVIDLAYPALRTLADLGMALFMFSMGLHAAHLAPPGERHSRWAVPAGSFLVPFLLGAGLAMMIAPEHGGSSRTVFVVFLGTAFAATAFPVLARILQEKRLTGTEIGNSAVGAAAICDVVCWTLMAIVIAASRPAADHRIWLAVAYLAAMVTVVRPLMRRWLQQNRAETPEGRVPVLLAGLLVSAFVADLVGLHLVLGAFIFGAIVPKDASGEPIRAFMSNAAPICSYLLLPTYFVLAGLRLDLTDLGIRDGTLLAAVLAVAVGGKFLGTYAGSRLGGLPHRRSVTLGVLMNTRGLTEIVILSIGLEAGVIDRELYTVMVVMALVTTAMTTPVLSLLDRRWGRPIHPTGPDLTDLTVVTAHPSTEIPGTSPLLTRPEVRSR